MYLACDASEVCPMQVLKIHSLIKTLESLSCMNMSSFFPSKIKNPLWGYTVLNVISMLSLSVLDNKYFATQKGKVAIFHIVLHVRRWVFKQWK